MCTTVLRGVSGIGSMPVPDGSRVQRGGWRPIASACSIQGGNTTGVTHEAAKRWVPERSKTRIRRTGYGVEHFPCRRRARQHPISCAGWVSSPTQQWAEFPESPRAAPAPVRRGDGGNSRPAGCGNGLRRRPIRSSVESCSEASGYSRRIAVRDEVTGAAPAGAPVASAGRARLTVMPRQDCSVTQDWEIRSTAGNPSGSDGWHTPVRGRPADGPLV